MDQMHDNKPVQSKVLSFNEKAVTPKAQKEELPKWRSNGLWVIFHVKKFVEMIKKTSKIYIFRRMSEKQLTIIGDTAVDFNYYKKNTFIQTSNMLSRMLDYVMSKISGENTVKLFKILSIHPQSNFQLTWDGIVFLISAFNIYFSTIDAVFLSKQDNGIPDEIKLLTNEFPVILLTIDIFIGLFTCYYEKGTLITEFRSTAKEYMKSDFVSDFLSIIPFVFEKHYFRLFFIFKFKRVFKILLNIQDSMFLKSEIAAIYQLLKLILTVIFIAHFSGCLFFLIHKSEIECGQQETWITSIDMENQPWQNQYVTSLYWGVITMITVGYGDIVPVTSEQRLLTIALTMVSCGVFGFAVNKIGIIFEDLRHRDQSFKKKFSNINQYLQERKLSHSVLIKVQRYCQYLHAQKVGNIEESQNFLKNELQETLKKEVLIDLNLKQLNKNKMLARNFSQEFLSSLAVELQEQVYGPGENLIVPGEQNRVLFFLLNGDVSLYIQGNESNPFDTISTHMIMGVESFFSGESADFGYKAQNFVRVLQIDRDSFTNILKNFKNDNEKFYKIRDDLIYYGRSFGLDTKCQVCQSFTHGMKQCPLVHYGISGDLMILRKIKRETNRERTKFQRSSERRKQFNHSLSNKQLYAIRLIQFLIQQCNQLDYDHGELLVAVENIESSHNIQFGNYSSDLQENQSLSESQASRKIQGNIASNSSEFPKTLNQPELLEQSLIRSTVSENEEGKFNSINENITIVANQKFNSQQLLNALPQLIQTKSLILDTSTSKQPSLQNYKSQEFFIKDDSINEIIVKPEIDINSRQYDLSERDSVQEGCAKSRKSISKDQFSLYPELNSDTIYESTIPVFFEINQKLEIKETMEIDQYTEFEKYNSHFNINNILKKLESEKEKKFQLELNTPFVSPGINRIVSRSNGCQLESKLKSVLHQYGRIKQNQLKISKSGSFTILKNEISSNQINKIQINSNDNSNLNISHEPQEFNVSRDQFLM